MKERLDLMFFLLVAFATVVFNPACGEMSLRDAGDGFLDAVVSDDDDATVTDDDASQGVRIIDDDDTTATDDVIGTDIDDATDDDDDATTDIDDAVCSPELCKEGRMCLIINDARQCVDDDATATDDDDDDATATDTTDDDDDDDATATDTTDDDDDDDATATDDDDVTDDVTDDDDATATDDDDVTDDDDATDTDTTDDDDATATDDDDVTDDDDATDTDDDDACSVDVDCPGAQLCEEGACVNPCTAGDITPFAGIETTCASGSRECKLAADGKATEWVTTTEPLVCAPGEVCEAQKCVLAPVGPEGVCRLTFTTPTPAHLTVYECGGQTVESGAAATSITLETSRFPSCFNAVLDVNGNGVVDMGAGDDWACNYWGSGHREVGVWSISCVQKGQWVDVSEMYSLESFYSRPPRPDADCRFVSTP